MCAFGQFRDPVVVAVPHDGHEPVVQHADPLLRQVVGSGLRAEDRSDRRGGAVRIPAAPHRDHDALLVVVGAEKEAHDDKRRVVDRVNAVVVPVLLVNSIPDALPVRQFAAPAHGVVHGFGEPAVGGNLRQADRHDLFDVAGHEGSREHRGHEHLAVDSVLDVGNARVLERQFRRSFRPSRRHVAEDVRANLRADPFPKGIPPGRRLRGPHAIDEVPVRRRFGRVEEMERHAAEPGLRHVARREVRTVVFQRKQTQDRVIHVVVPVHELDVVPSAGLQARRNRAFDERNVVVEGQRAGRLEVLVNALPGPAFHRFAQRASRRPAKPGAEDAVANRLVPKPHVHAPGPVRT